MQPVTDTRDIRIMIPEVRRAIDGPLASASASVAASLTDDQMVGLIADAVADVLLLTGGFFGYALEVTHRDELYMAPDEWQTDRELDSNARAVVRSQAALNYFFQQTKDMTVNERIADEGGVWEWAKSPTLLTAWLKQLQSQRDAGLTALQNAGHVLDSYVSFVAERDILTAAYVEPWVAEIGRPTPTGILPGGQEFDWSS